MKFAAAEDTMVKAAAMRTGHLLAVAALALLAASAAAREYRLKGIVIDHPRAVPTVPGASTGALYLSLHNRARQADRLVAVSTPRAKRVELHRVSMSGGIMRMREVDAIELKPGAHLAMQRGGEGHHLMLVDLAAPLKAGDAFPLTLRFETSGRIEVSVTVEQPKPGKPAGQGHRHP